jgi:ribosomal-protein-alanine N-acetyltransferase
VERIDAHIRWMIRRDMPTVYGIEQACFEFPWTEREFIDMLRSRNIIGVVAEDTGDLVEDEEGRQGGVIVGYMIYSLHPKSLHIVNLAVEQASQKRGVGRQLIQKLFSKLSQQRRTAITTDIRETNVAAVRFFQKMGFEFQEVLRGVYEDSDEDAYRLAYRLPSLVTP